MMKSRDVRLVSTTKGPAKIRVRRGKAGVRALVVDSYGRELARTGLYFRVFQKHAVEEAARIAKGL